MHLRTVSEIALHVESFRNIDLWYQGVYFLKFAIYHSTNNNTKIYALPYAVTQSPTSNSSQAINQKSKTSTSNSQLQKTYDYQVVGLSSINKNQSTFRTKAFHLRYFQEEVEIGDVCRWRIEVGTFQQKDEGGDKDYKKVDGVESGCIELTVQMGLYFYDSFKKQQSETANVWQGQAKQVSSTKFTLPFNPLKPSLTNTCMPILFTDQYFSLTSCTIHVVTLDYKLRMNQITLKEFASWSEEQRRKKLKEMMVRKNQTVVNSRKLSVRGYLKGAFGVEKEEEVMGLMVGLMESMGNLAQIILKQYTKLYNFCTNSQSQPHAHTKPTLPHTIPPHIKPTAPNPKLTHSHFNQPLPSQHPKKPQTEQTNIINRPLLDQHRKHPQSTEQHQQQLLTILTQISHQGQANLQLFNKLITLIKHNSLVSTKLYHHIYTLQQQQFYNKLLTINYIYPQKTAQFNSLIIATAHNNRHPQLLESLQTLKANIKINTDIYDRRLYNKITQLPLLIIQSFTEYPFKTHVISHQAAFQNHQKNNHFLSNTNNSPQIETYPLTPLLQPQLQGIHLVILVHGFQGTSYDMKAIKNHLSHLYPQSMFLCCTSNEQQTDGDIFEMGARLAVEIKEFIFENLTHSNNSDSGLSLQRISFIGHSLGGLKIRAALPKLLQYKNMFCNFISLSSPHIGYNINTSAVVDAGLWVLQKLMDSQCLGQLKMMDSKNPYETTLYKLSLLQGIEHFRKVFLFSSRQDSYASYSSARIEIDPQYVDDNNPLKAVHCEMVRNILKNVSKQALHRVDVTFTINTTNIDSLIGRTAHIMFLENPQVIRVFLSLCHEVFL